MPEQYQVPAGLRRRYQHYKDMGREDLARTFASSIESEWGLPPGTISMPPAVSEKGMVRLSPQQQMEYRIALATAQSNVQRALMQKDQQGSIDAIGDADTLLVALINQRGGIEQKKIDAYKNEVAAAEAEKVEIRKGLVRSEDLMTDASQAALITSAGAAYSDARDSNDAGTWAQFTLEANAVFAKVPSTTSYAAVLDAIAEEANANPSQVGKPAETGAMVEESLFGFYGILPEELDEAHPNFDPAAQAKARASLDTEELGEGISDAASSALIQFGTHRAKWAKHTKPTRNQLAEIEARKTRARAQIDEAYIGLPSEAKRAIEASLDVSAAYSEIQVQVLEGEMTPEEAQKRVIGWQDVRQASQVRAQTPPGGENIAIGSISDLIRELDENPRNTFAQGVKEEILTSTDFKTFMRDTGYTDPNYAFQMLGKMEKTRGREDVEKNEAVRMFRVAEGLDAPTGRLEARNAKMWARAQPEKYAELKATAEARGAGLTQGADAPEDRTVAEGAEALSEDATYAQGQAAAGQDVEGRQDDQDRMLDRIGENLVRGVRRRQERRADRRTDRLEGRQAKQGVVPEWKGDLAELMGGELETVAGTELGEEPDDAVRTAQLLRAQGIPEGKINEVLLRGESQGLYTLDDVQAALGGERSLTEERLGEELEIEDEEEYTPQELAAHQRTKQLEAELGEDIEEETRLLPDQPEDVEFAVAEGRGAFPEGRLRRAREREYGGGRLGFGQVPDPETVSEPVSEEDVAAAAAATPQEPVDIVTASPGKGAWRYVRGADGTLRVYKDTSEAKATKHQWAEKRPTAEQEAAIVAKHPKLESTPGAKVAAPAEKRSAWEVFQGDWAEGLAKDVEDQLKADEAARPGPLEKAVEEAGTAAGEGLGELIGGLFNYDPPEDGAPAETPAEGEPAAEPAAETPAEPAAEEADAPAAEGEESDVAEKVLEGTAKETKGTKSTGGVSAVSPNLNPVTGVDLRPMVAQSTGADLWKKNMAEYQKQHPGFNYTDPATTPKQRQDFLDWTQNLQQQRSPIPNPDNLGGAAQ